MGFLSNLFKSGSKASTGSSWLDIATTGLDLYGQYTSGKEKKKTLDTQAQNSKENAAYELQRAADSDQRGAEDAEKYAKSARRYKGSQLAAMGASGVVAGSGSFQSVANETDQVTDADLQTIMRNTMREAYGHRQAAEYGFRTADNYSSAADNAKLSSELGMAGTIMAGNYSGGKTRKFWE
jgi:hypothetical protein